LMRLESYCPISGFAMRMDLNEVGQRIPPPYASEKSARYH
jgi:hypothetical protein